MATVTWHRKIILDSIFVTSKEWMTISLLRKEKMRNKSAITIWWKLPQLVPLFVFEGRLPYLKIVFHKNLTKRSSSINKTASVKSLQNCHMKSCTCCFDVLSRKPVLKSEKTRQSNSYWKTRFKNIQTKNQF